MAISVRNSFKAFLAMLVIATAGFTFSPDVMAQDAASSKLNEQKIKAGLIYNFLKFTTWPETSLSEEKNHMNICLYGGDSFNNYLDPLKGRTAQQFVINITEPHKLGELDVCHVVFINKNQKKKLPQILQYLKGKNILTMSDIDNFATSGGMVEFTMENDRHIHLYVSVRSIENGGLNIQNRLLKLTELVD